MGGSLGKELGISVASPTPTTPFFFFSPDFLAPEQGVTPMGPGRG